MATKKFPSEMSSRGTVLGTDKILIYNATTGASDEVCTVAELFTYISYIQNQNASAQTASLWINGNATIGDLLQRAAGTNVIGKRIASANDNYDTNIYSNLTATTDGTGGAHIQLFADKSGTLSSGQVFITAFGQGTGVDGNAIVFSTRSGANAITERGRFTSAGGFLMATDNASKPGAGGLWTVVSDARIKKDIELADLDICYDTIKNIPLKRFAWADGVYSEEQVSDRHNLGWIAQDVQKYFSKAVSVKPFTKNAKIADGVEEYQEQDFVMEDKKVTSIEMINGSPVQVTKIVQEKVLLFDELPVKDELGEVVLENRKPLLAKVPKMVTKTRPKFRQEVIEDCLDLNSGQLNAALYGAVQACMLKIESLEKEIALLKQ